MLAPELITSAEVRQRFGGISERTLYKWSRRPGFPAPAIAKSGRRPAQWNAREIQEYGHGQPLYIANPSFQQFSTTSLDAVFQVDRRTIVRWAEQLDFPAPRILSVAGCRQSGVRQMVGDQHYWHIVDLLNWIDRLEEQNYSFSQIRHEQLMAAYMERFRRVRVHSPTIGSRVQFFLWIDGLVREIEGRVTQPCIVDSAPTEFYSIAGTITLDYCFAMIQRQTQIPLWGLLAREQ